MSNFSRNINDIGMLKEQLASNEFLQKVNKDLIQEGRALLTFRNNEATIYYKGRRLCNLAASNDYVPTIYNHFLPIIRSQTILGSKKKEAYSVDQWKRNIGSLDLSFGDVVPEILDNLEKQKDPEGCQASEFYCFSPLNHHKKHEIVLLDIEAAFAGTGEKTDRIDLVFYHTIDKRLMFVEVKRLSDDRLYEKEMASADAIDQLKRYKNRLESEAQQINSQYNNVIDYYNALSDRKLQKISEESKPLLGLLLVEYKQADAHKK